MSVATLIERKVSEAVPVAHLALENESHKHSVPPNSETHFKLVLAEELAGPVHALALHTYTVAEWQAKGGEVSESPDCLGGSKHDPEFKA